MFLINQLELKNLYNLVLGKQYSNLISIETKWIGVEKL